jgi:hypothetical protein
VLIQHPFGQPFEALVVDVARAVEPRSRWAGHGDPVVALHTIFVFEHIGATQDDTSGDRGALVCDEDDRALRSPGVAEGPEACGGRAGDHHLGVGCAGRCTPRLERVRRGRDPIHAVVDTHERSTFDGAVDLAM